MPHDNPIRLRYALAILLGFSLFFILLNRNSIEPDPNGVGEAQIIERYRQDSIRAARVADSLARQRLPPAR